MEGFAPTAYVTVRCGDTQTVSPATLHPGPAELLVQSDDENGYLKLDINSAKSYFGLEDDGPIDIPFSLEDVIKFGFCSGDIALVDNVSLYEGNVCVLCHKKLFDKFNLRRHLTSVHKLPVSSVAKDFLIQPFSTQLNSEIKAVESSDTNCAVAGPGPKETTSEEKSSKTQTLTPINSKSPAQDRRVLKPHSRTETLVTPSSRHQRQRVQSIEKETPNLEKTTPTTPIAVPESNEDPVKGIFNTSERLNNHPCKDKPLTRNRVSKFEQSSSKPEAGSKSAENLTPSSFLNNHNRRTSGRLSSLAEKKNESDGKNDFLKENISKISRPTKNYPNQTVSVYSTKKNPLKVFNTVNLTESSTNQDASRKRSFDGRFMCCKCSVKFNTQAHLTLHTLKNHSSQRSGPQTIDSEARSTTKRKSFNTAISGSVTKCQETLKGRPRGRNSSPSDLVEPESKEIVKPLKNQNRSSVDSQANRVSNGRKFHHFEASSSPVNKLKNLITLLEAINWSRGITRVPHLQ